MDNKDQKPAEGVAPAAEPGAGQAVPADALGKTPEQLAEEGIASGSIEVDPNEGLEKNGKKPSALKQFLRKVNIYLIGFVFIVIVVAATAVVSYLNSQKAPKAASVATQSLSQDALKQLANSDASVGSATQTLTVQGNAIFSGQVLIKKDLDVAGRIKLGGDLLAQNLTVSGKSNFADTQANSLQVATNTTVQGTTTLKDVTVSGLSSFGGPMNASQITVTRLILSGNAVLQVPNHLAFTGPAPSRSIDTAALGAGGTASVNGSDVSGTISISSGNSPAAGCWAKITFAQPFSGVPRVIVSPFGAAAGVTQYYVTKTAAGFSVCGNTAAPANQVFGFDYFVSG